jgi:hypothetical protein
MPQHKHPRRPEDLPPGIELNPKAPPPEDNTEAVPTDGPQFAEPAPTPDPTQFTVRHGSDKEAYTILDSEKGSLKPQKFPIVANAEPRMTLADALGAQGTTVLASIKKAEELVFHAVGDTGNTHGPKDQNLVADKMVSDFNETDPRAVPSFCYHLGDVVYSFGEREYYYDQFYDPYRDYPAPIFAIAGNHDGMVAPGSKTPTLAAFLENFCTAGEPFHRTPETGGLSRTAGRQPGVYFTLDVDPFVRILGLYSNCLEDPGVISTQTGSPQTYSYLTNVQVEYLEAALKRAEKFEGAVLIAVHHPPYTAPKSEGPAGGGKHEGSPLMLADIDRACAEAKVWPHAVLSGHAHNYQRFTRYKDGRETPFVVMGDSGHGVTRLTKKSQATLRVPMTLSSGKEKDKVVFENYDDSNFGYLRILITETQLRIEFHPASDGPSAKTPDDAVTVDLKTHKLVPFRAS